MVWPAAIEALRHSLAASVTHFQGPEHEGVAALALVEWLATGVARGEFWYHACRSHRPRAHTGFRAEMAAP